MIYKGIHYKNLPWRWRRKYKYTLIEDVTVFVGILGTAIDTNWFTLSIDGFLTIKAGYAWDGCTGMIDTNSNMEAGLVHDCLYQMLREALIPNYKTIALLDHSKCLKKFRKMREQVDNVFEILLEAGNCWDITVLVAPRVVKSMGEKYALPKFLKKLKE